MICIELINNEQLKFQNEDEANLFVYCLPNSLKEYLLNTNTIQDDFVSNSLIKYHSEYINNTFKNININDEDLSHLLKNTKNINIIIDKLVNLIGVKQVYNKVSNLKTKNLDLYNETLFALNHIDNIYKDINELTQTKFEQVDSNNYEDVIKANTASDATLSITTSVNNRESLVKKSTLEQNKKYIPISIENNLIIDNTVIDKIVESLNDIDEEKFYEQTNKDEEKIKENSSSAIGRKEISSKDTIKYDTLIKPEVQKLFDSNPKLANEVYKALGFQGNINLESNLKNTGKTEEELIEYLKNKYPEIKLNISNNPVWEQGDNIFNQEEFNNQVQYRLKAVEILSSDKAKQIFEKGEKNKWNLDRILTELQIPKEQKQIILNLGKTNREEIITNLLTNFSYTIEINTAKQKILEKGKYVNNIQFNLDGFTYIKEGLIYGKFKTGTNDKVIFIDKEEFEEAKRKKLAQEEKPTQYYSNLTVPGGINYRENEIVTPSIKPSFKGHAKFSTDKGIGWFRSDEKSNIGQINTDLEQLEEDYRNGALTENEYKDELQRLAEQGIYRKNDSIKDSKTRRILEIQSDLFQKNRDENIALAWNRYILNDKEEIIGENPNFQNEKDFLNVFRKDNNWVKFFIKSIIQDSAKKGYEKVWFPNGDTASKVEGHTTLEEFKKQKEEAILRNEKRLNSYSIQPFNNKGFKIFVGDAPQFDIFKTKEEAEQKVKEMSANDIREIAQLKQEIERIEKEGFGSLRPVWNFYENTISNILNKIYGKENVKQITDEYGNTWNEITINQARDLSNILLQRDEANRIIGQANIRAMSVLVDAINKKADTIPHEYAHHYIAWFRDTPIVQEAIKRFGSEEALVQAIGEQVVKQKGEAYNWWKKFTNWILSLLSDKQLLQILTDSFLNRYNLNDFTYNEVNEKQKQLAIQLYSEYLESLNKPNVNPNIKTNVNTKQEPEDKSRDKNYKQFEKLFSDEENKFFVAEQNIRDLAERVSARIGISYKFENDKTKKYKRYYKNGEAVINLAYATLNTPIYEILGYPIIKVLKNKNSKLYKNLLEEIKIGRGKEVLDKIKKNYTELSLEEQQEEAIVILLGELTTNKLNEVKDKNLIFILKQLLKETNDFVRSLFSSEEINLDFNESDITYTDENGKLCAENGLQLSKFQKGGTWEIIKEFKGKSHEQGGIDIEISNGVIKMSNKQNKFKAKFGLLIPITKYYAQDGIIVSELYK